MNLALPVPTDLAKLVAEVPALGRCYFVGGCVRDALLGRPVTDFDLEVHGVGFEELAAALRPFGRVDLVGRSFGVVKLVLGGAVHDFSLPRRDSKCGPGHRGFEAEFDPTIEPRDAAARRDFTINALMVDAHSSGLLDFFGGVEDLRHRVLRHTGPAFGEDPLRVLRGLQFASRFDLTAASETLALCRQIASSFGELPVDRLRGEWWKWAALSVRPSAGLRFLEAGGWLVHFPEIAGLRGVAQEPDWHPEGDVFEHTGHCLDALVDLPEWQVAPEDDRVVWTLAVLAHDFGKAVATRVVERNGRPRIVSPGHERDSVPLAASFLGRIGTPHRIVDRVLPLVANHMAHFGDVTERAVRRLARRLHPETIDHLCVLMTADAFGRPPRPREVPASVTALRRVAAGLAVADAAPRPILLGRHLVALGLAPGRDVGRWAAAAFEAQLDGRFHDLDGAYAWLAEHGSAPEPLAAAARKAAERKNL